MTPLRPGLALAAALFPLLGSGPATGQDRAAIDATAIYGNRELPKVLYIVPWKKPLPAPLSGRPELSVLDEPLLPLDREVFRRRLAYEQQQAALQPSGVTTARPAAPLSSDVSSSISSEKK